jgi:hypothetical protein
VIATTTIAGSLRLDQAAKIRNYAEPLRRNRVWRAEVFAAEQYCEYRGATELTKLRDWPTAEQLTAIFRDSLDLVAIKGFSLSPPKPRRRTKSPRKHQDFYEPSIYLTRNIPTRFADWHDLCNAMIWGSFPRSKHSLNILQTQLFCHANPEPIMQLANRSRAQDILTMLDEGACLVWKDASGNLHRTIFGHGALECLIYDSNDFVPMDIHIESPIVEDNTITSLDLALADYLERLGSQLVDPTGPTPTRSMRGEESSVQMRVSSSANARLLDELAR